MRIEEELKMISSIDNFQKLYLNVVYSSIWLEHLVNEQLKKYKISSPQYNILRILNSYYPNPLPAVAIQERMFYKNSNVTRIIDKLIEKELVLKQYNHENRRMVNITIAPKGLEIIHKLSSVFSNLAGILPNNNLSVEEAHTVNSLLEKMRS